MFNLIQVAQAHEEGAELVTIENIMGPVLSILIIIIAYLIIKKFFKK